MDRSRIPLNALRAFEAAARHLNFTRAALELRVTQAALSHQIKALEAQTGCALFRRLPRGVALTDEGAALYPVLAQSFDRIGITMDLFAEGRFHEVVTLGVVSSFATGWLLPHLDDFSIRHPGVDLRILTNNNRVDLSGEGLDFALRFGDGSWHGVEAHPVMDAPLAAMAAPALADRMTQPDGFATVPLLRSYRADEWPRWFEAAGLACPKLRGPVFDSSIAIAEAAMSGFGIALLPLPLFARALSDGRLVRVHPVTISAGSYWLTRLRTHAETAGMAAFRRWLIDKAAGEEAPFSLPRAPASPPAT